MFQAEVIILLILYAWWGKSWYSFKCFPDEEGMCYYELTSARQTSMESSFLLCVSINNGDGDKPQAMIKDVWIINSVVFDCAHYNNYRLNHDLQMDCGYG